MNYRRRLDLNPIGSRSRDKSGAPLRRRPVALRGDGLLGPLDARRGALGGDRPIKQPKHLRAGIDLQDIEHGQARIRIQVSAAHTDEQLDRAIAAFTVVLLARSPFSRKEAMPGSSSAMRTRIGIANVVLLR